MNSTPQFSRRRFVQAATVAGAASSLSLLTAVESEGGRCRRRSSRRTGTGATTPRRLDVGDLTYAHFEGLIGDDFVVGGSPNLASHLEATLTLVDVSRHLVDDERPSHVRQEAFSLLFVARDGEQLPDETHWVHHPRMFRMALFLHKTRRDDISDDSSQQEAYVAVFN